MHHRKRRRPGEAPPPARLIPWTPPQALGPRPLPRPEAVEEALRKLDLENGEEPGSVGDAHQTALANNPSDYFGMVG